MELPLWGRLTIGIALAAALAYVATPVAVVAARRFAFYDRPGGYKGHAAPTPYLGGAAVMTAFALALLVGGPGDPSRVVPLLGGVAALFVLGTADDRRTVPPLLRVAVELALGVLLSAVGRGWHLGAGQPIDALINGVWVVAVVNAFNLFDNMDGAAATMAIVVAGGACVLGWLNGNAWAVAGNAALCGACLGFLPHNLSRPARIFLGDGGSMPLGFAVAALVASAARGAEPSLLGLLTGLLLVGIPALDTCLVITSRRRRGVSILAGGQDHLTHRTRQRMRTARRVVFVLGSVQALISALVIVASREGSVALVYVVLAFVISAAATVIGLEQAAVSPAPAQRARTAACDERQGSTAWNDRAAELMLAVVGLGAGLSPLFYGYYGVGAWVPLGLGLMIAAVVVTIARPAPVTLPVTLSVTGLAGLGLWSLLSAGWAHAGEQATVQANRWLSYAALLLLAVALVRGRRRATVLLGALGLGIAIVAASVLMRLLGGEPGALFLAGRLNAPLGYVNGEGCVFAMGCWLGLALAERREPLLAGLGAAWAVAMACLTLLSQSRGAAIASFVMLVLALVAIPGVRRRALALAAIAAGVSAAAGSVLRVYSTGTAGLAPVSVEHRAGAAILACSAVTGLAWGVAIALERALERRGERARSRLRRGATALTTIMLTVPLVAAIVRLPAIERTVRTQWHAFVHLSDSGSSPGAADTRLFSGAGNRYDYWRIAWHAFLAHPVSGVGAGNYAVAYYRQRRTQEAIENPHSLELQTLSELGVVGALLLALTLAGVLAGARRLRAAARGSSAPRTTMVAATGLAVVWLVDTSGDWMHLLPGVTAIALSAVAVLCRGGEVGGPASHSASVKRGLPALTGAAGVAFVLAVGGASLLRSALVQRYVADARSELRTHPAAAIGDAQRALRLDGANLDAYYIKAAGQARFDQSAAARSTLLAAARADPDSFVTWTLLGDLEVRLRDFGAAKAFYRRAHALDPNDPALASLAADPAAALSPPRT